MENGLLVGLSRQAALERQLDVVANNIANLNTFGFKSSTSVFQEYLSAGRARERFRAADAAGALRLRPRRRFTISIRVRSSGPETRSTSRSTATASSRCRRRAANVTRATARCISTPPASSSLPTATRIAGDNGPIVLQATDRNISISADGRITVLDGNAVGRGPARQAQARQLRAAAAARRPKARTCFGAGGRGAAGGHQRARHPGRGRRVERQRRRSR